MVLVHGLGGSSVNWHAVGPGLATGARVLAPDLAGFGRSPLAGRSARVRANQRLLGRFIDELAVDPVILVGNSMGGMIALLEAADHPERVAGLVLVDPAVPRPRGVRLDREIGLAFAAYAVPGLGKRLLARQRARAGPEGMVADVLQACCAEPGQVPAELVAELESATRERADFDWADAAFLQATRSLIATLVLRPRRYLRLIAEVDVPTLVIQGAADRLVPLASIEALVRDRPDWTVHVLAGIGHVPHVEAPRRFVELVRDWLEGLTAEPDRQAG
jgi:pimeloyl-ACP methyl ester carboxylesterase